MAKLLEQRKKTIDDASSQHEVLVDTIKGKMQATIDKKERVAHELTISNAKLKVAAERYRREKQTAEETYTKLRNTLESERTNLKSKFEQTSKRISETEARLEAEIGQSEHAAAQLQSLSTEVDAKEIKIAELTASREKDKLSSEHKIDSLSKSLRDAESKLEAKKFEIDKMQMLINEAKETTKHRLNDSIQQLNGELEDAKLHAESARAYARDRENAMQEQIENSAKHTTKVRAEKEVIIEQIEKKLSEEREASARMTVRNQELGVRVNMLAAEKAELAIIVAESDGKIEDLEGNLAEAEAQVSDVSVVVVACSREPTQAKPRMEPSQSH